RGQVTIDGLTVRVPILDGPGLVWKRLAVRIDPVDLAGHRAVVRVVDLEGSYLVARARGGVFFPFMGQVVTGQPAANSGGNAAPPPDGNTGVPESEKPPPNANAQPPPPPPPSAPAQTTAAETPPC